MNGQTEVTSSNTYSAVTGWEALTVGSNNANEGVIWIGNGTFTGGVPATKYFSGAIGQNKGLSAYYVVPNAKTLYLQEFAANMASGTREIEFFVQASDDGAVWTTEFVFGLNEGSSIRVPIISGELAAGTHIRVQADASLASSIISVALAGQLVDD